MTTVVSLQDVAQLTDPAAREMVSRLVESEITMLEARTSQLRQIQEALRETSD
jgi:hypothetical protein